ncbi:MAG: acetoacetate--CoA ligase [Actinobacteria bacterium]|nr:acetoacetate--CoA ligase [Actinomycetota bacterium]
MAAASDAGLSPLRGAEGPLWAPDSDRASATQLTAFAQLVTVRWRQSVADYPVLHAWSVEHPDQFWRAVRDHADLAGDWDGPVIEPAPEMWRTRFFPDAAVSYAENALRRDDDGTAIIAVDEQGRERSLSWHELRSLVARVQRALREQGVQPGDRVAAFLPNIPECVALMLACSGIGAVFSSCSPDFGVSAVVDRFGQIEPTVLVAIDGYHYDDTFHDCIGRVQEMRASLPSVRQVPIVQLDPDEWRGDAIDGAVPFTDWLGPDDAHELELQRLPFDHPLYILYSSGTTGAPKCIVHRAGGILLKHAAELRLQCDIRPDDRVVYFTTTGWMMWNWLASVLLCEATIVLYDGSPMARDGRMLWDVAETHRVTLFGTSARFLDASRRQGLRPHDTHDLSSVRTLTSTGSPLSPESFDYVYRDVKPDVHLASISGGTDLCGCLVAGDPTGPVWRGEIQRPGLGMAIEVFDGDGRPLGAGVRGELVCTAPFPSMPLGLWGDDDDRKLRSTYFDAFPGAWHQGDFAEWTEHGGMVIHGRSDATLNPGGVRLGTAEIYRAAESVDGVVESVAIGQEWDGDTRVVLFVVLDPGVELDDELTAAIKDRIRSETSPRHVPAKVLAVGELPRTRSGKVAELSVRDIVHGRDITNREALANPDSLDDYRDRAELRA